MKVYITIIILIFCGVQAFAQHDTLVMKNGDELIGEVKELLKGVLTMETDYSDKDFRVEWNKVGEIHTKNTYVISHTDGRRINGTITTDPEDSSLVIIFEPGGIVSVRRMDIVALKQLENTFLGRLDVSFDVGFNIAKANNLRQFTTRSYLGYTGRFWASDASIDIGNSLQDSVLTKRLDASLSGKWLFQRSWFFYVSAKFYKMMNRNSSCVPLQMGVSGNSSSTPTRSISGPKPVWPGTTSSLQMIHQPEIVWKLQLELN